MSESGLLLTPPGSFPYPRFREIKMHTSNALFGRMQIQQYSINNLIQWGNHLSVEYPGIDGQHKAIFDLGTKVYESWRSGGGVDALRPAMDKLAHLLPAHFAYEERLLAEIGYADLDQHVAEHRSMLDELASVQERFQSFRDDRDSRGGSCLPRAGRSCSSFSGSPSGMS